MSINISLVAAGAQLPENLLSPEVQVVKPNRYDGCLIFPEDEDKAFPPVFPVKKTVPPKKICGRKWVRKEGTCQRNVYKYRMCAYHLKAWRDKHPFCDHP